MILLQASSSSTSTVSMWTIFAALAAILSSISAFRSSRFAKRSLKLAQKAFEDRKANFSLYLIKGCRWSSKDTDNRKLLLFHVSISNKSDSKSSFKAELEIEYIRADQSIVRAIVPHDENLQPVISDKKLAAFTNDIRIEERGMQSKWLFFEQPSNVFKEFRIEKYTITVTDTQGHVQTLNSIILNEINNGQKKDNC